MVLGGFGLLVRWCVGAACFVGALIVVYAGVCGFTVLLLGFGLLDLGFVVHICCYLFALDAGVFV